MANQKNSKKTPLFVCESCDFKCCKQNEYKRHIETNKHKMLTDANKKTPKHESNSFVCICGNKYNHKSSFSRHKGTCVVYKSSKEECENNDSKYDNIIADNKDNEDDIDNDKVEDDDVEDIDDVEDDEVDDDEIEDDIDADVVENKIENKIETVTKTEVKMKTKTEIKVK